MSSNTELAISMQLAIKIYLTVLADARITLRIRRDFEDYNAVRRSYGELHLNQAFDPQFIKFGDHDFWLLAQNHCGEPIATYCVRRCVADDFYDVIRSQSLWFGPRPRVVDPRFVVECEIAPFGGEVAYEGGNWVREDYRGASRRPRLSHVMSRLARAIALRDRPFDHTSAMIRNDPRDPGEVTNRKANSLGVAACGFARVHRFVDGWFPPEGRAAIMHLCHATRAEAVASIVASPPGGSPVPLGRPELGQGSLVEQNEQLIHKQAVSRKGQQQSRV